MERIDFSGMATVYDVLCKDGRIIKPGAFDSQVGQIVPLVWHHGHKDMRNVVGHGMLQSSESPPGMRILAIFNSTKEGNRAKTLVHDGDVRFLSIWANEIIEHANSDGHSEVTSGVIREVSLVLVGANPGASIEDVIRHSDDPLHPDYVELDGIVVHNDDEHSIYIFTGDEDEDFLEQHGVKGMHWGVKRPDGPDGTVTGTAGKGTPTKGGGNSNSGASKPKPTTPKPTAARSSGTEEEKKKAATISDLRNQAERAREAGNTELAEEIEAQIAKLEAGESEPKDGEKTSVDGEGKEGEEDEEDKEKEEKGKGGGGGGAGKDSKLQDKAKKAEEDKKKIQAKLDAARKALTEKYQSEIKSATEKVAELNTELETLQKQADKQNADSEAAHRAGKADEANKLGQGAKETEAKMTKMQDEIKAHQDEIKELQKQLDEWSPKKKDDKKVEHSDEPDELDIFLGVLTEEELSDLDEFAHSLPEDAELDLFIFDEDLDANEIAHYGVKGMRWGVRRKLGKATGARLLTKKGRSEAAGEAKKDPLNKALGKAGAKVKKGLVANTEVGLFVKEERGRRGQMLRDDISKVTGVAGRIGGRIDAIKSGYHKKWANRYNKVADDNDKMVKEFDDAAAKFKKMAEDGEVGTGSLKSKVITERAAQARKKDIKSFLDGADELEELSTKYDYGSKEAKKYTDQAKSFREMAGALQKMNDTAAAKSSKTNAETSKFFKEIADELRPSSAVMRGYAKRSQAKADALDKKRAARHSDEPEPGDILHAISGLEKNVAPESDLTVAEIVESLNEDQKALFNILIHSAVTGEIKPPATGDEAVSNGGATVKETFDSLTEEQKNTLYYVAGELSQTLSHEDQNQMTKNIFEPNNGQEDVTLSHAAEIKTVVSTALARKPGSLRELFKEMDVDVSFGHSVTNIDYMFPDAKNVQPGGPQFYSRPMEWVERVLGAVQHRPFSRIKSMYADLTPIEARAKGYVTGNQKVEEVIGVLKRTTTPQTIYKLQKLDRDDILDITDFDVVVWLKTEMRMMLREELARAILITDGRANTGDDAILTTNVRPVFGDDAVYTINAVYNDPGNEKALSALTDDETRDLIDFVASSMQEYRGKGSPVFYCQPAVLTKMMLVRDANGLRLHRTEAELASALRVSAIVEIPPMAGMSEDDVVDPTSVPAVPAGTYDIATLGVVVNLNDYVIGMDRGGQTSFFEDFDIDYNKYAYLYETRLSGALVNPKSAISIQLVTAKTA